MHFRTKLMAGLAAVAVSAVAAIGAGMFPGLPIVGGAAYCVSSLMNPLTNTAVTGSCNGPTTPAGPAVVTGNELIPADTQLSSGQSPQTVLIPSGALAQHGQGGFRNALIGGDFATNLWQRGTTFSSLTPTTSTMTADRWAVYSSGNTVTVSKQTGASDVILSAGLGASMRVNRPSATDVTDICVGQVLPQKDAARLLGQTVVFSWYGLNGSTMSATSGRVKAYIAYMTAADSATPGTNTDTFMKSTSTGYANAVSAGATGTTATVASAIATIAQSTTWTRYAVYGAIPTTATSVGVKLCYTPVGTGASTDWFEVAGAQLETSPSGAPQAGSFARRPVAEEAITQLSYSFIVTEGAAGVAVTPSGQGASTTTCILAIPFPTQMREAPTFAAAGTALSSSTWTITHVVTATALATPYLAVVTGGNTVNNGNLTATVASGLTAGQTCILTGAAGGSLLAFSAEP